MAIFDTESADFECPECGATVTTTIGEVRKSPTLTCPNGHEISVDGSDLDRATGEVQKSIDSLHETIRDINRRNQ